MRCPKYIKETIVYNKVNVYSQYIEEQEPINFQTAYYRLAHRSSRKGTKQRPLFVKHHVSNKNGIFILFFFSPARAADCAVNINIFGHCKMENSFYNTLLVVCTNSFL